MLKTRMNHKAAVFIAALAAVFAFSAIDPAYAAERKSIRWSTSSTGSYGYKVAAQMVRVLEEGLGGQYTVTVNPYPATTNAMKATMDGDAEIGYTADVGMTQTYTGDGPFKTFNPAKSKTAQIGMCTRWSRLWPCWPRRPGLVLRLQWQAGILHSRRLHELAEFPAHLQGARLPVQTRPNRRSGPRATPFRPGLSLALSPIRPQGGRCRPIGARQSCALISKRSTRARMRSRRSRPAAGLAPVEIDATKAFSKDVGVKTVLGVPILFAYNVRADMPERSSTRC